MQYAYQHTLWLHVISVILMTTSFTSTMSLQRLQFTEKYEMLAVLQNDKWLKITDRREKEREVFVELMIMEPKCLSRQWWHHRLHRQTNADCQCTTVMPWGVVLAHSLIEVVLHQHTVHCSHIQGRPVNVKHGARCAMGKVRGEDKKPKPNFNVLL